MAQAAQVAQGKTEVAQGRTEVAQGRTEVAQGRTEVPQGRIEVAHFRTEVAQPRGGKIVASTKETSQCNTHCNTAQQTCGWFARGVKIVAVLLPISRICA